MTSRPTELLCSAARGGVWGPDPDGLVPDEATRGPRVRTNDVG